MRMRGEADSSSRIPPYHAFCVALLVLVIFLVFVVILPVYLVFVVVLLKCLVVCLVDTLLVCCTVLFFKSKNKNEV